MPNETEYIGFDDYKGVFIPAKIMNKLKNFSPAEFMVLAEMLRSKQNDELFNIKTIIENTGLSEYEVNSSIERLLELKIINKKDENK